MAKSHSTASHQVVIRDGKEFWDATKLTAELGISQQRLSYWSLHGAQGEKLYPIVESVDVPCSQRSRRGNAYVRVLRKQKRFLDVAKAESLLARWQSNKRLPGRFKLD